MATRQYIGARYVPKFFENPNTHDNEWLSGASYEALTIVTYYNNSYTSKKPVPSTVGNPADNPSYWVVTGNYNAQVEQYREDVETGIAEINQTVSEFTGDITQQQTTFEDNITQRQNSFETLTNETINNYKDAIDESEANYKADTDTSLNNMQTQINNLVISGGDSSAEVLQARGQFSTLNDRLSTMLGINRTQASIDDLTTPGIYRATVPSTYAAELGLTIDNYFFTCIVYKPATAVAGDVIQMLIAVSTVTNTNHVFVRNSYNNAWSVPFSKLTTPENILTYTVTRSDIDSLTTCGVFGATVSNSYNDQLNINVDDYYFTCFVMKPATLASQDVVQMLVACNRNTPHINKVYVRNSYSGNWTNPFVELTNPDNVYKWNLPSTDIDNATTPGTYRTTIPSTYESELLINLNDYWFTVCVIKPATLASQDVIQLLVAQSTTNTKTNHVYIRNSYGGRWTVPFAELTNGGVNNRVMFCGDSFTANNITKSYADFLDEWGYCKSDIKAFGGATAQSWFARFENDITSDCDTFFIALGLNNVNSSEGAINDTAGADTYVGGMKSILNKIITTNPKARIIIFMMDSWMNTHVSSLGQELASMYGCEFYSMKANANIPVRLSGKFDGVMDLTQTVIVAKDTAYRISEQDGHPNVNAQKMLASYLRHII